MKSWIAFFCCLFFFGVVSFAQDADIDSLENELEKTKKDTLKVNILLEMAQAGSDDSLCFFYCEKAKKTLLGFKPSKLFHSKTLAKINSIKGSYYSRKGDYEIALEYFYRAREFLEKENLINLLGSNLNQIGFIHLNLGQFEEAIDFFQKSYSYNQMTKDTFSMSTSLSNMAVTYGFLKQNEKRFLKLKEALGLATSSKNLKSTSSILNNIAVYFYHTGHMDSAKIYMQKSLEISINSKHKYDLGFAYLGASNFYRLINELDTSLSYAIKAKNIGEEIGSLDMVRRGSLEMYSTYVEWKKYKEALESYIFSRDLADSLVSEKSKSAALKSQYKYEREKQAAITKAEKERQNLIIVMISGGLLLVLVFSGFLFNRFRVTNKQKKIIESQKATVETQKAEVEEKNKEITDSITYAKRLQDAILPSVNSIKNAFPESFVFYKPKDIVAGDFYWMESLSSPLGEISRQIGTEGVLLAVADCTGHGVPGAMVSVVCNNALNRSVREFNLTEPGKILDKTRQLVIETFKANEENVNDGMDISLISLSPAPLIPEASGETGINLLYAGANNPLWVVSKKESMNTDTLNFKHETPNLWLHEIKPNKQPIGRYAGEKKFTTHTVELQKGDTVYLFSDGFADQFGGDKGKKFKYKPFKELLLSIYNKPMDEQGAIIERAFKKWKGDLWQVDDVCIIGVRI